MKTNRLRLDKFKSIKPGILWHVAGVMEADKNNCANAGYLHNPMQRQQAA